MNNTKKLAQPSGLSRTTCSGFWIVEWAIYGGEKPNWRPDNWRPEPGKYEEYSDALKKAEEMVDGNANNKIPDAKIMCRCVKFERMDLEPILPKR